MSQEQTTLAAIAAAFTHRIEQYMNDVPQEIHIHHHIHGGKPGGPWGRGSEEGKRRGKGSRSGGRGGPDSRGPGGRGRHGSRRSVIRAFGAVRRGGEISADEFSDLQQVQRDLEQRLADLSDLIETIERDGLVTQAPNSADVDPSDDDA